MSYCISSCYNTSLQFWSVVIVNVAHLAPLVLRWLSSQSSFSSAWSSSTFSDLSSSIFEVVIYIAAFMTADAEQRATFTIVHRASCIGHDRQSSKLPKKRGLVSQKTEGSIQPNLSRMSAHVGLASNPRLTWFSITITGIEGTITWVSPKFNIWRHILEVVGLGCWVAIKFVLVWTGP